MFDVIPDHGIDPARLEAASDGRVLADDAAAVQLLNSAAAAVVGYLRWCPWPRRTDSVVLDGNGTDVLSLPSRYVVNVDSVAIDGVPLGGAGYRWSQTGMVERIGWMWPDGFRRITVTFTHGVDVVPNSLSDIIVGLAARNAASPGGRVMVRAGGVAEQWSGESAAGGLLAPERAALDDYRIGGGGFGV